MKTIWQVDGYPGFEQKVLFLKNPEHYEVPTQGVESIETHMSWIFLTDEHAWKLKKPVKREFLDFSTLERRCWACQEEIRLNRRLAPTVYLEVIPLTVDNFGRLSLNGSGKTVDWLVKMRKLPRTRCLEVLGQHAGIHEEDVQDAAEHLVRFYTSAPALEMTVDDYLQSFRCSILVNQLELAKFQKFIDMELLNEVTQFQLHVLKDEPELLTARVTDGHIIDAHGDLRPEHIWLCAPPVITDSLEFNAELRQMDPVSELSFLKLECDRLELSRCGQIFLDVYHARKRDEPPLKLLQFYRCWHACTRAKLALWHLADDDVEDPEKWKQRAERYLALTTTREA